MPASSAADSLGRCTLLGDSNLFQGKAAFSMPLQSLLQGPSRLTTLCLVCNSAVCLSGPHWQPPCTTVNNIKCHQ